jgi:hypothetical protein
MIELLSGMPAPQFRDESLCVVGSELVQGSSGSIRCFHILIRKCGGLDSTKPYGSTEPINRDSFTFTLLINLSKDGILSSSYYLY